MTQRTVFPIVRSTVLLLLVLGAALPVSAQANVLADLETQAGQLCSQGRFLEALPLARQAVTEAKTEFGDQSLAYGVALSGRGFVLLSLARNAEAEADLVSAYAIIAKAVGADSPQIATTQANLAMLYFNEASAAQAQPAECARLLAKAEPYVVSNHEIALKNMPADSPAQLPSLDALAQVYAAEKKFAAAKTLAEQSLAIELKSYPPGHVQVIRTRSQIAWLMLQMGDTAGSIASYREVLALAEKSLGPDHPMTQQVREGLRLAQGGSLTGSTGSSSSVSAGGPSLESIA